MFSVTTHHTHLEVRRGGETTLWEYGKTLGCGQREKEIEREWSVLSVKMSRHRPALNTEIRLEFYTKKICCGIHDECVMVYQRLPVAPGYNMLNNDQKI